VGKWNRVRICVHPWVGCGETYKLSGNLVKSLQEKGLVHVVIESRMEIGKSYKLNW